MIVGEIGPGKGAVVIASCDGGTGAEIIDEMCSLIEEDMTGTVIVADSCTMDYCAKDALAMARVYPMEYPAYPKFGNPEYTPINAPQKIGCRRPAFPPTIIHRRMPSHISGFKGLNLKKRLDK